LLICGDGDLGRGEGKAADKILLKTLADADELRHPCVICARNFHTWSACFPSFFQSRC
jgi:hypothetical protein